jgi:hypothetical protein
MTAVRRRAAVLWAVIVSLLVALAASAVAADGGADIAADRVVVVGVPGLIWADVDPERTPELWALTEESAVGALSVRAARSTTCVLDGWATLGAGNRARFPGPDDGLPPVPMPQVPLPDDEAAPEPPPAEDGDADQPAEQDAPATAVDTTLAHCGLQERVASVGLAEPEITLERTAKDEGTARFGAEPGALGDAVGCATVSGRAATMAVAAPGVDITRQDSLPTDSTALGAVLDGCPLTLVSLEQLSAAGAPGANKTDFGTDPGPRADALTAIDEQLGLLRAAVDALPGETLLILAGISEVNDGRPQLHVGIASGPGFASPGWLTSASTGRPPYVQLIDVAPTVLQALDLPVPASMNGQPLQVTGERPGPAETVAELVDVNTAATVHHRNVSTFFWIVVIASAVLVVLGMVVLGGWQRGRPAVAGGSAGARRALRLLALGAAALPVATYLAGLVPWESTGAPVAAMAGAVLAADLVVTAVAALGPWRSHPLGPPLAIVAITLATLLLDVLTGSTLELNGLLGYDAIVAGRFTGYGNLSFGLLSVTALLVTAALATMVGRRVRPERARLATIGTVVGLGLVTIAIVGAPGLGRDFGGVLSALPGFLLLALLLVRARVTVVRLALILGAAVVAVGAVAYLDWLRPAAERSHLGRFVEQLLTGEAWTVVSRKGQANLDILLGSPLAKMLPVTLVAVVWLVRPGGLLRSRRSDDGDVTGPAGLPVRNAFALRAGLLAGALSLTLGAAVNDSGVALPATAAALLVPLLVWLAASARSGGTAKGEVADGTPRSGPVDDPDRVTVVSRGSTVWNA